jgi:hypothetical protein
MPMALAGVVSFQACCVPPLQCPKYLVGSIAALGPPHPFDDLHNHGGRPDSARRGQPDSLATLSSTLPWTTGPEQTATGKSMAPQ